MKKATVAQNGFEGYLYDRNVTGKACILLLMIRPGDSFVDKGIGKWLNRQNIAAIGISTYLTKQIRQGQFCMPLEWIQRAINWAKGFGYERFAVMGLSLGSTMALSAAARIPELTLCVALSPSYVVFEGTANKGLMYEFPAGHSAFTWKGEELPYQPYYLSADEFMKKYNDDSKKYGETYGRGVFDHSFVTKAPSEETIIPVENINGTIALYAVKKDTDWDSEGGIRKIEERLKVKGFTHPVKTTIYEHGTHFLFPEGVPFVDLIGKLQHKEPRQYPKECREVRHQFTLSLEALFREWQEP